MSQLTWSTKGMTIVHELRTQEAGRMASCMPSTALLIWEKYLRLLHRKNNRASFFDLAPSGSQTPEGARAYGLLKKNT